MGSVTFVEPRLLVLLVLLAPLWAIAIAGRRLEGAARRRRVASWRAWTSLMLRSLILAALVLALAGTQVVRAAPNMTTVFVLDTSDSISPAARARGEAYIAKALRTMPEGDRAAVVVFGADAMVERPPSEDKELVRLRLAPDSSATEIAKALRLALATLPADMGRRVVLLSDGGETRQSEGSSALDVAAEARAAGIPVETVSLAGPPTANDVALETLEAPANAREGQTVRLVVQARLQQARGAAPERARLRLLRDRQPILDTTVELQPGVNRIPLTATTPRGFHTWEAHIEAANDSIGANNAGFGFTDVRGPPRLLLVEGAPGRATNLEAALRSANLETQTIAPGALPQTLAGLDVWDAVALVDVPFGQLPPAAAKALPAYVRELGHGLLMVGGEDSYAAGGYQETPVETALPVTMRVRGADVRPDVALVLIIDRSGSMSGQKLNLAKEGVAQAFSALEANDQVGVIAFDTAADWVVDLQRKPATDTFLGKVGDIGVGGGTDLRPGLEQAAGALERANAKIKHVVLLTDGQADRNYDDVVERLKRDHITLSTVGVGSDYDPHLRDVAPAAGGRFYEALDFGAIPRLFFDETLRVVRRGIVEQTFTPRLGSLLGPAAPVVRELREIPALHGYNAVTPRDTAQVALVAPGGDPILAEWQFGLGRAAAWTSDMKGQWARDWVGWNGFGRFAAQLAESLVAQPEADGYEVRASVAGAGLAVDLRVDATADRSSGGAGTQRVAGRLVGPGGNAIPVPMAEREAGRFQGTIPLPSAGVYRVQIVTTGADGTERLVATTGAVVPPSAEYLQPEGNPGLLKAIAETTAGQTDFPATSAFRRPARISHRSAPVSWPLLWLAVLLWPLDIAARRLLLPYRSWDRVPSTIRRLVSRQPRRTAHEPSPQGMRRAEALLRARGNTETRPGDGPRHPGTSSPASASPEGEPPRTADKTGAAGSTAFPARSPAGRPTWRDTRRSIPERPRDRR